MFNWLEEIAEKLGLGGPSQVVHWLLGQVDEDGSHKRNLGIPHEWQTLTIRETPAYALHVEH